jgi:hypothetical protein
MSKIVNWGHWLVGAFFVFLSASMLWHPLTGLPKLLQLLRHYPPYMTYVVVEDALTWAAVLICGWGIFRWRRWGRVLGIVLSAYLLAVCVTGLTYFQQGIRASWPLFLLGLISCSVFIWLFLPAVRAEYLRRNQLA